MEWTVYVLGYPLKAHLDDPQIGQQLRIEGVVVEITGIDRVKKTLDTKRVS